MTGALVGLAFGIGLVLLLGGPGSPRQRRSPRLTELARRAGLPRTSGATIVAACAGLAVVVGVLALLVTAVPVIALLAALGASALPVLLLRRRVAARQRVLQSAWPDAVDQLMSAVRAGLSLPEALGALGTHGPLPLRAAFGEFAADYRSASDFGGALDRLQGALADPVADRVITSLRVARDVGGTDLGTVLRTLSMLLREDARTRGEIESRQSWTIAAARMAVAAPWITLALLSTRPEAVDAYRSTGGALVITGAAVASLVAYRAMLRIARLPAEPRLVRA